MCEMMTPRLWLECLSGCWCCKLGKNIQEEEYGWVGEVAQWVLLWTRRTWDVCGGFQWKWNYNEKFGLKIRIWRILEYMWLLKTKRWMEWSSEDVYKKKGQWQNPVFKRLWEEGTLAKAAPQHRIQDGHKLGREPDNGDVMQCKGRGIWDNWGVGGAPNKIP